MDFKELVKTRYSVRAYKRRPVSKAKIDSVLTAARFAPTASNRQPFKIIVIHTKSREEELLSVYPREWFVHAPLVICICGIPSMAWTRKLDKRQYLYVDAAIVMDHMILAATDLGLGTCFIAAFNADNARKALSIPADAEPILFTPLGYPNCTPKMKERKSLEKLVSYERW